MRLPASSTRRRVYSCSSEPSRSSPFGANVDEDLGRSAFIVLVEEGACARKTGRVGPSKAFFMAQVERADFLDDGGRGSSAGGGVGRRACWRGLRMVSGWGLRCTTVTITNHSSSLFSTSIPGSFSANRRANRQSHRVHVHLLEHPPHSIASPASRRCRTICHHAAGIGKSSQE